MSHFGLWVRYEAILVKAFSAFATFLHNCFKGEQKVKWKSIVIFNTACFSADNRYNCAIFKEKFILVVFGPEVM